MAPVPVFPELGVMVPQDPVVPATLVNITVSLRWLPVPATVAVITRVSVPLATGVASGVAATVVVLPLVFVWSIVVEADELLALSVAVTVQKPATAEGV